MPEERPDVLTEAVYVKSRILQKWYDAEEGEPKQRYHIALEVLKECFPEAFAKK